MTDFSLRHSPIARKFYVDNRRITMLMGPVGSGKSVASMFKIIRKAAEQHPSEDGVRKTRFAVVRNTYKQLEDTTIKTWLDWFPSPTWGKYLVQDNNYNMQWVLDDDTVVQCEILFRALDRPDQAQNLLSAEYTGAWFNEARHIDPDIFDMMDNRIGRFPAQKDGGCDWMGILMDTNPPDEDHWLYTLFEEKRPDNCAAFYQPSGLSPEAENIPNLPAGYYENIVKTKDEFYIHVYVHGRYGFLREGKPVYPEFNDHIHVQADLQPLSGVPLNVGLDFGLTPAAVVTQLSPDGRLLVLDEITSERAGIKQFLEAALPYLARTYPELDVENWYVDPAGNQKSQADMTSPFDIMIDAGVFPTPGEQKPEVRIESVKQLLTRMVDGKPAIVLSPHAKMLRKGFNGHYHYRRLQVSKERYTDKPDKNEASHVHDALQYLCTRMFGIGYDVNAKPVRVVGGFR